MASELKIASAFFFDRRSSNSSSFDSGRPKRSARTRARARPRRSAGRMPPLVATSWPWGRCTGRRVRGAVRRDPPVAGLAALEGAPTPDHDPDSTTAKGKRTHSGSDHEADREGRLTQKAESEPGRLRPRGARECCRLGLVKARQSDGHGDAGEDECDRNIDLQERSVELITGNHGRQRVMIRSMLQRIGPPKWRSTAVSTN